LNEICVIQIKVTCYKVSSLKMRLVRDMV